MAIQHFLFKVYTIRLVDIFLTLNYYKLHYCLPVPYAPKVKLCLRGVHHWMCSEASTVPGPPDIPNRPYTLRCQTVRH